MRQLKWERPLPSRFSEETICFWRIYQAFSRDESDSFYESTGEPGFRLPALLPPLTGSNSGKELNDAIFDFAHCMALTDRFPSLVAMDVPFGVRRLFYEMDSSSCGLEDVIAYALNAEDANFNNWVATSNPEPVIKSRALLAKCIWKWYFKVFEPRAIRFCSSGSEFYKP